MLRLQENRPHSPLATRTHRIASDARKAGWWLTELQYTTNRSWGLWVGRRPWPRAWPILCRVGARDCRVTKYFDVFGRIHVSNSQSGTLLTMDDSRSQEAPARARRLSAYKSFFGRHVPLADFRHLLNKSDSLAGHTPRLFRYKTFFGQRVPLADFRHLLTIEAMRRRPLTENLFSASVSVTPISGTYYMRALGVPQDATEAGGWLTERAFSSMRSWGFVGHQDN